jgi:hypothetical protein
LLLGIGLGTQLAVLTVFNRQQEDECEAIESNIIGIALLNRHGLVDTIKSYCALGFYKDSHNFVAVRRRARPHRHKGRQANGNFSIEIELQQPDLVVLGWNTLR